MDDKTIPEYFDVNFYAALIEAIQDGVFVVKDSRFVLVNQAFADILGEAKKNLIGTLFSKKVAPEYQNLIANDYQSRKNDNNPLNEYQIEFFHSEGHQITVQLKVENFNNKDDDTYIIGSVRDVISQLNLIKKLQKSESEFKQIIENLPGVFYRTDAKGNLIMASPYALNILGYTPENALGKPVTQFYANPEERAATLAKIIENNGEPVEIETLMRCYDGSTFWVSTSAYARYDENKNLLGVEGISLNITKQKNLEYELRDKTIKDPLTKLINRFGLQEHLEKTLTRAKRQRNHISIIFIDLDDFKQINDCFGHAKGDDYLIEFSKRLNENFRASDIVTRIGGDEFVILLDDNTLEQSVNDLLYRLEQKMQKPLKLDDELVNLKYSYGIATYPKHGKSASDLLKYADKQMYFYKKKLV